MTYGLTRGQRVLAAGTLMLAWLAVLWVLTLLDGSNPSCLVGDPEPPMVCEYGIEPRVVSGLPDIFSAAFLHFGTEHLAANSLPLLIFGFLAALRGIGRFLAVCGLIVIVSGLGVWLIEESGSVTAGVSGVIFGLFGYLLTRGFVERNALDITVGLVVLLFYGPILWGALPVTAADGVSWEGHFFGLVGGVLAAYWLRRSPARTAPGGPRGRGTTGVL